MPTLISKRAIAPAKAHHHLLKLMGCRFVLTAVHTDPQIAWDALRAGVAEIERIERSISSWREDSQTGKINRMSGIVPVKVNDELFQLIKRCVELSKITGGAFDISGTLARYYWKFDGKESQMPAPEKIAELKNRMGFRNIVLDEENKTVFLKVKGMKIGFGAIGKGYAAYRGKLIMEKMGIENGVVNASGDLLCWGKPPKQKAWDVKISDPENPDFVLSEFTIPHGSVVTSGGYENFALIDGEKYSHIIDPRTGMPAESVKSVSIICPNPELGDALATAVTVLGEEKGMKLIQRLKGVECLIVNRAGEMRYSKK